MGPIKIASAHKQVYKIFKKGVGHELFLNQNLGHATKTFGNHCPILMHYKQAERMKQNGDTDEEFHNLYFIGTLA